MEIINENVFDTEQLNLLFQKRRSVFPEQYVAGKKIPDETVMQLLENANWAPSHKLTEPWRFVVFSGEGLKKLAEFQSSLYKETSGEKFKQGRYEKLQTTPLLCSHIIALGMKRSGSVPEIEEVEAVACAVENLFLSMTAYGLGGYWSTGGVTYIEEAKSFFGLNEQDKLLGFFYLGYVQTPSVQGKRAPVSEKIIWVKE
ncbi:MAG TPA: nitroreductase [Puia sp.]|jgi:nitroreductase|nr:nitroreductase [Puia sp.]